MNVYIVSWGILANGSHIELDSIVHTSREAAEEEFAKLDVNTVATKRRAENSLGIRDAYCTLTEVEMLDEKDRPCDNVQAWVFDGATTLLAEKTTE